MREELQYIMKEQYPDGKIWHGVFYLEKDTYKNNVVRSSFSTCSSLEELAEAFSKIFDYSDPTHFSFEKREAFPDFCIMRGAYPKRILKYVELTPEEQTRFLTYAQRVFEGKPLKKRHNPEITLEDKEKAEAGE